MSVDDDPRSSLGTGAANRSPAAAHRARWRTERKALEATDVFEERQSIECRRYAHQALKRMRAARRHRDIGIPARPFDRAECCPRGVSDGRGRCRVSYRSGHPAVIVGRRPGLLLLREQREGLLDELGQGGEELGAAGAVERAVVARQGQHHHRLHGRLAVDRDDAVGDAAHGQDRGLRRIHDRGEAVDAVHAEVADREPAALDVGGPQACPAWARPTSVLALGPRSRPGRACPRGGSPGPTSPSSIATARPMLMSACRTIAPSFHDAFTPRMLRDARRRPASPGDPCR